LTDLFNKFQQPFMMIGEGLIRGKGRAPNHVAVVGSIYVIAAVVALLLSVPYWQMIGAI